MSFDHNADHRKEAVALLIEAYRYSPRICALIQALASGVQCAEDMISALVFDRNFQGSTGPVLEQWGRLIGEERTGLDDSEYRAIIAARILANACQGDTDSMIAVVQAMFPNFAIRHDNVYPASALFFAGPVGPSDLPSKQYMARASKVLQDAKPAGIGVGGVLIRAGYFGFFEDPDALGYNVGQFSGNF